MPIRKPQAQHRPATRAPHGEREFSERIALCVTPTQRALFKKRGSMWVRQLIDRERATSEVIRRAQALIDALGAVDFSARTETYLVNLQTAIRKVQAP